MTAASASVNLSPPLSQVNGQDFPIQEVKTLLTDMLSNRQFRFPIYYLALFVGCKWNDDVRNFASYVQQFSTSDDNKAQCFIELLERQDCFKLETLAAAIDYSFIQGGGRLTKQQIALKLKLNELPELQMDFVQLRVPKDLLEDHPLSFKDVMMILFKEGILNIHEHRLLISLLGDKVSFASSFFSELNHVLCIDAIFQQLGVNLTLKKLSEACADVRLGAAAKNIQAYYQDSPAMPTPSLWSAHHIPTLKVQAPKAVQKAERAEIKVIKKQAKQQQDVKQGKWHEVVDVSKLSCCKIVNAQGRTQRLYLSEFFAPHVKEIIIGLGGNLQYYESLKCTHDDKSEKMMDKVFSNWSQGFFDPDKELKVNQDRSWLNLIEVIEPLLSNDERQDERYTQLLSQLDTSV